MAGTLGQRRRDHLWQRPPRGRSQAPEQDFGHRPRRDLLRAPGGSRDDYATTVADVEHHQIIDILPSRNYVEVAAWLDKQPKSWKQRIEYGALDMSATYAAVYSVVLPQAAQVADPFHVVACAMRRHVAGSG